MTIATNRLTDGSIEMTDHDNDGDDYPEDPDQPAAEADDDYVIEEASDDDVEGVEQPEQPAAEADDDVEDVEQPEQPAAEADDDYVIEEVSDDDIEGVEDVDQPAAEADDDYDLEEISDDDIEGVEQPEQPAAEADDDYVIEEIPDDEPAQPVGDDGGDELHEVAVDPVDGSDTELDEVAVEPAGVADAPDTSEVPVGDVEQPVAEADPVEPTDETEQFEDDDAVADEPASDADDTDDAPSVEVQRTTERPDIEVEPLPEPGEHPVPATLTVYRDQTAHQSRELTASMTVLGAGAAPKASQDEPDTEEPDEIETVEPVDDQLDDAPEEIADVEPVDDAQPVEAADELDDVEPIDDVEPVDDESDVATAGDNLDQRDESDAPQPGADSESEGREQYVDLSEIDDEILAGRHVAIFKQNKNYTLYALSDEPTQVNDELVGLGERRRLEDGDVVVLGEEIAVQFDLQAA